MAHHKSTIKRIRTNEKSRLYNKHYKSQSNSAINSVLEAESKEDGNTKMKNAFRLLDRLVNRNIIHRNKAANKKSQLSRHVNKLK